MAVKCPVCGRKFKNKRALATHMRMKHGKTSKEKHKVTNTKAKVVKKGKVIHIYAQLDKDKPYEEVRVYLQGSGKRSKPARVWGLKTK